MNIAQGLTAVGFFVGLTFVVVAIKMVYFWVTEEAQSGVRSLLFLAGTLALIFVLGATL